MVRFESDCGGWHQAGQNLHPATWQLRSGCEARSGQHRHRRCGSPAVHAAGARRQRGENETPFYSTFTGPAIYTQAAKYQKVEFAQIEGNKADFIKVASDGYVAMVQHYFASAWLLGDGIEREPLCPQSGCQQVLN